MVMLENIVKELGSVFPLPVKQVSALGVLNEAYDYARPSSFSRGLRL